MSHKKSKNQSILSDMPPAKAIVKLAIPATLALLAKAVYNLVDTAYIGMLNSDIALTAVGVTVPLHSDSAKAAGRRRHLRLSARGGYPNHSGLCFLHSRNEAHCIEQYASRRAIRQSGLSPGSPLC